MVFEFGQVGCYVFGRGDAGHAVAAKLQDDEPRVQEVEGLSGHGLVHAGEDGARAAAQRHVVDGHARVAVEHDGIDLGVALEADGAPLDVGRQGPADERHAVVGVEHLGFGGHGVAFERGREALAVAAQQHRDGGERLGLLEGLRVVGLAEADRAAAEHLAVLRHHAVAVVGGALVGGVAINGVAHHARRALRHRDGGHGLHRRDHVGPRAAKVLLQLLAQHRRDAVHLDLRVAVVHHAVGLAFVVRRFEQVEERVEVGVVVVGQIDAVGVVLQVVAEEAHTVQEVVGDGHLEALVHLAEHIVDVHLSWLGVAVVGIGGETQVEAADGEAFGGEEIPSGTEDDDDGEDEYEGSYGFHCLLFKTSRKNTEIMLDGVTD